MICAGAFAIAVMATAIVDCEAAVTANMRERMFFRHLASVDIDGILNNKRLIDKYFKCLLKTGKCDPAMRDLRVSLPLILEHLCENRCNEKERTNLQKIFEFVRNKRSQEWERLQKLYDPKGQYIIRIEAFISGKPVTASTPSIRNTSAPVR